MNQIVLAFLFTTLAGLATGIGGLLAFYTKTTNTRFLSFSMGVSAGVMIYISFVEMFPDAEHTLTKYFGDDGKLYTVIFFFVGMFIIALIDKVIPSYENPHEMRSIEEVDDRSLSKIDKSKLLRTGFFTALAITIHNFPEGIAAFMSMLAEDSTIGFSIVGAIAIHNIPEGIAISIPLYYATGSKKKALLYSFLSGLSEPLGAIIAYWFLLPYFEQFPYILGFVFAAVAGIMVFISIDELLPAAEEYGEHHYSIYGVISGMMVMAFSLLIM